MPQGWLGPGRIAVQPLTVQATFAARTLTGFQLLTTNAQAGLHRHWCREVSNKLTLRLAATSPTDLHPTPEGIELLFDGRSVSQGRELVRESVQPREQIRHG